MNLPLSNTPAKPVLPALSALRSATASAHRQLESRLDLLRAGFTRNDYSRLLQRFYGFYAAWEPEFLRLAPADLRDFYQPRKKCPFLLRDFAFLNVDPVAIPLASDLPPLQTEWDLLGSLYVVEGSTLGGQVISRHLGPLLQLTPDAGLAFFNSYGSLTEERWIAFRHLLDSDRIGGPEIEAITGSAGRTFAFLEHWLCPGEEG
jgi:heme oxygenase